MKFEEEKIEQKIDSEDIKGIKENHNPDFEESEEEDDNEDNEEDDDENEKKKKSHKYKMQRSMTFVGTAEYISPEVIEDKPAEFGTDVWAFGVMLYQMYYNDTPFRDTTNIGTFQKIKEVKYEFKDSTIMDNLSDLIKRILVKEPKQRLGGGDPGTPYDIEHLKKHPFFKKINWETIHDEPPPNITKCKFYETKKNI